MAIGWLTILQSVPWADMVTHAPKVASGARKLWDSVGRSTPEIPRALAPAPFRFPAEAQSLGELQWRIGELEAALVATQDQMTTYSGLIKELAAQNTQLLAHLEVQRRRMGWLIGVLAVTSLVAVASLAVGLMR